MNVRWAVRQSLEMLERRDRRLLLLSIFAQSLLALLDLIGVLLIAIVGALGMSIVSSQPAPGLVQPAINLLHLGEREPIQIIISLAALAAFLLATKSFVSAYLVHRVLNFLGSRQAMVSLKLTRKLLNQPLLEVTRTSSQETAYALTTGVTASTVLLLGAAVAAAGEICLLIFVGGALVVIDPLTAIGAIIYFGLVAVVLQRLMGKRAGKIGSETGAIDVLSIEAVQEVVSMYRELTVLHRRQFFIEKIGELRLSAANLVAATQFMSQIPKYVFEVALVIGGTGLAFLLFSIKDSVGAVSYLVLFLAAATRIMPSLMRLQGSAVQIRTGAGIATPTYSLFNRLNICADDDTDTDLPSSAQSPTFDALSDVHFVPKVSMLNVSFSYPGQSDWCLENIDLEIEPGSSVAIIGPSGSGKSTIADLILGMITPDSGQVLISGRSPRDALKKWSGEIAYVPQHVFEASGSIRANVAIGVPEFLIDDDRVRKALKQAQLLNVLTESNMNLSTRIGEFGIRLSGGQRQRLGLARALYSNPQLLVLDEATSALDAETENLISKTLESLRGEITTVTIAHRLATVRDANTVIYVDKGKIVGMGTFTEVRELVPQMARTADLLGLS